MENSNTSSEEGKIPAPEDLPAGRQGKLLRPHTLFERFGKRVWLLPALFLLLLLILIFILTVKKTTPPQITQPSTPTNAISIPSPETMENITANWKTYTNTKYGFWLSIPPTMNYSFSENVNSDSQLGIKSLDQVSFYEGEPAEAGGYMGPSFNINIYPEKGNEQWINGDQSPSDTISDFVIAGTTVKKISGVAGVRIGPLKKDGYIFKFENINGNTSEKEIDQILSTFKFTD